MDLKKWIKNWDERVLKWYDNPKEEVNSSIDSKFYKGKGQKSLNNKSLPEPYIGDPFKSSFVTINLNPGPIIQELQNHKIGRYTKDVIEKKSYYEIFKSFPYLQENKKNGGYKFWEKRINWANRLIKAQTGDISDKNPFALEIVPYHSQNFGSIKYKTEYLNHINKNVIEIAEKSLEYSQLDLIISVGKPIYDIFDRLGFDKIVELNRDKYPSEIEWQLNKNKENSYRYFSLWKSPNGFYFYNTYAPGGNTMPAENWLDIEIFIMDKMS